MFQYGGFAAAIDAERKRRELRWVDVAHQAGVAKSTILRVQQGSHPDLDTVAKLLDWAEMDPNKFFSDHKMRMATIPAVIAIIQADPEIGEYAKRAIVEVVATMHRISVEFVNVGMTLLS